MTANVLAEFRGRSARWKKPVVCIVDKGSRSAKEIFAYQWKEAELGPVIGETTAGAVIGAIFRDLADGSVLMLPAVRVKRLIGVDLEGRGVDPDIPVDPGPLRYREGRDVIFERGLQVLLGLCDPRLKRRYR